MLNARTLGELFAKNIHPELYPRIFLTTMNGTLLAYNKPVADMRQLRNQAAMVSRAWKDYFMPTDPPKEEPKRNDSPEETDSNTPHETLAEYTARSGGNVIVRALQNKLLLVLIGGIPPGTVKEFNIIYETASDSRYPDPETARAQVAPPKPPQQLQGQPSKRRLRGSPPPQASLRNTPSFSSEELTVSTSPAPSAQSELTPREKELRKGALHIQRKRLDSLADYISKELQEKDFTMPDDSVFK
ncbi:hypothetical protein K402DRAFT_342191 [Aulographum hederae CBS 113979]|uniref:Uncharacterized protein n=1 Tax=Aulographum hederae CBS 113979 TaxID=1176131 RepID=A0A6G1GLE5_9PEZI|nr:hypothetical protein K402DRAFT_342191 [Aulographum hederae CBS 113979]